MLAGVPAQRTLSVIIKTEVGDRIFQDNSLPNLLSLAHREPEIKP